MEYRMIIGASSEISKELMKSNLNLKYILTDIEPNLTEVQLFIKEYKIDAIIYSLNTRDIKKIQKIFNDITTNNYKIKELIYIAGYNYFCEAILITEEIWDEIVDINLKGCFFAMQGAGKNMITNNIKGSIVNISSQHGIVGNVDRAPYCSSKAALLNLNKVLALEWADFEIRVNSVSPTFILYKKNYDFLMSPSSKNKYLKNIPLKKYCKAEDISNAIQFLLSDQSRMITGHNLLIDGGWTIK